MIETYPVYCAGAHYTRLKSEACERIHAASLEILDRVGVDVHDERARELLRHGGARVDGIRVRLSETMVQRALNTVPRHMRLCDRNGRVVMRAGGYRSYFGGGSDCLHVLDHRTGVRRRAVLQDVIEATLVQDALPEIDFVMSMFLPSDVDGRIYDRYQMEVMLHHTAKPIVFVTPDLAGCIAAVEMCEIVAGGRQAFQERPFAACYINVTSGLIANAEALQKSIYLAERGLPQMYIPLNAGGVNAPVTTAGCMAVLNAGTLLGIVLTQLVREGAPVAVAGWNGGPYNLQTMVGNYVLAEEQGVATAMGKFYNLPVFGLGGATDSKVLDQQCGFEVTLSLMTALLCGANIVHDVGFMDAGMQASLALMVIADDILGFLRAATKQVRVDDETLALEVIEELGPTGSYLEHPHTLRHFREAYYSRLADKNVYAVWASHGATSMETRAAQRVEAILAEHRPPPLPEDVTRALREVVLREAQRLAGG